MRCLSIIYGGILGQPTKETSVVLIRELMNILSRGEVDTIEFNHIRMESPLYQLSRKMPGVFSRDYFPIIEPHWVMTIPKNIESFYQTISSGSRKQYKKCIRRLEREFPGQVRYQIYSQENHFDEAIKYVSLISEKTYQYSMGCGFVNNCFTRTLLQKAAQKGWLRIHILFIGSEACAFEIWLRYKKIYFGHGIGFDPKWKKWRVGTVLFLKTIEILCADTAVEFIDFGFGDADYKRSYADIQWQEASVYIFARRFYPSCINILRTCVAAMNAVLEYVLNKSGLTNRIKRFWRNRLEEKSSEKEP